MKEFRVRLKVRNNRLIRYREDLGMTPRDLAEALGSSYHQYLRYEALTQSPLSGPSARYDQWRPSARKIAEFHGVDPEELWPDAVLQLKTSTAERTMGAEELSLVSATSTTALATASVEDDFDETEMRDVAGRVLLSLDPQERKVLAMRFGLLGESEQTLEEIGDQFRRQRERIRQIESKALRKLRHPSRTKLLKTFVQDARPRIESMVVYTVDGRCWLACGHVVAHSKGEDEPPEYLRCFTCTPITHKERHEKVLEQERRAAHKKEVAQRKAIEKARDEALAEARERHRQAAAARAAEERAFKRTGVPSTVWQWTCDGCGRKANSLTRTTLPNGWVATPFGVKRFWCGNLCRHVHP